MDRDLLLAEGAVIALRGLLAKAEQENAELRANVERLKSGDDEELEHKVQAVLLKHFADKGACCSIDALTEYVMEPVTAALAGLKGERDALRQKTDNEFHDAAVAYAIQSAALSQAQQALRIAIEFGYKGCEKGWNLEKTLLEFK